MRVLGFDPGLVRTGYGCVEGEVARPGVVEAGVIRLGLAGAAGEEGEAGREPAAVGWDRLVELERDVVETLRRLSPDAVAVESVFSHAAFPATAIKMAHARGVIVLAVRRAGVPLLELAPRLIKQCVTGSGRASKAQVQASVAQLLGLSAVPEPPDVADALAAAVAGLVRGGGGTGPSIAVDL